MAKILAVAGSFRKHSFNKRILNIAVRAAREAGAEVTVLDMLDHPLPILNMDLLNEQGFDKNALKLQDIFMEHDGFLIASPEYNTSIPGGFKNLLDWVSRANDKYKTNQVFAGKIGAIMAASPGQFGGVRCLNHLRAVLSLMGISLLPSEVAVPLAGSKFDGDGVEIKDERTKASLEKLGVALVQRLSQAS